MSGAVAKRVARIDWQAIARDLDETGYALTGRLAFGRRLRRRQRSL